ncbi:hypothetical protein [Halosolutus halophilus]|uniref:hypothetical protein n=1 Tax=Halosolutus halophilus TaxID=1552990 RepID=UPI002235225B|nr:hypothetical protein [Halosolutus halophilus]
MEAAQFPNRIPTQYLAALLAILLLSLVYAVAIGQIGAWIWGLMALVSLGVTVFVIYLFYRLVLAVERIAYEQ